MWHHYAGYQLWILGNNGCEEYAIPVGISTVWKKHEIQLSLGYNMLVTAFYIICRDYIGQKYVLFGFWDFSCVIIVFTRVQFDLGTYVKLKLLQTFNAWHKYTTPSNPTVCYFPKFFVLVMLNTVYTFLEIVSCLKVITIQNYCVTIKLFNGFFFS